MDAAAAKHVVSSRLVSSRRWKMHWETLINNSLLFNGKPQATGLWKTQSPAACR